MRIIVSILGAALILPCYAHAGQYSQRCQQAGQQSQQQCQAAAQGAQGADNAQAAGNIAGVGSSANINPGANALGNQAAAQAARLQQALNQCQQAKQNCDQQCDQAKQQAQQDPKARQQGEPAQVDQAKQSSCDAPLAAMMAPLSQGAQNAQQAGQQSGQTAGATPGMPGSPGSGQGNTQNPSPTPMPSPTNMTCGQDGTQAFSQCNATFVNQCQSSMGASPCDGFIQRYCNSTSSTANSSATSSSSSSSTSSPPADGTSTGTMAMDGQSLTPGRIGEGVGTPFCNQATAYNFCTDQTTGQPDPSRANCQTCRNYRAQTSAGCMSDPNLCQADSSGASCPVPEPITGSTPMGSGSVATGLSTQSLTPGGAAAAAKAAARGPASSGLPKINAGVDEGEGAAGSEGYKPGKFEFMKMGAARPAKKAATIKITDVSSQFGPTLFNIGTATYRRLCTAGKLKNCGH